MKTLERGNEMRRTLIAALIVAAAVVMAAPQTFNAQERQRGTGDLPEIEEIRQTYELAQGAKVEVSGINGPVDIETHYGDTAEIHIVRSARTREDLNYRRINISHTRDGLVVAGERDDRDRRNVQVRHRVTMKIPRQVTLTAQSINGRATVGEIEGPVHLRSINGRLEVGQAVDYAELASINGRVTMTIARLGERGIKMNNINGAIDLRFLDGLNADLDVEYINGNVRSDLPNVELQKLSRSSFRGRIGAGGTPLTMSHINGSITIR